MQLFVYYDEKNPGSWISKEESSIIKEICLKRGAKPIDSASLPSILDSEPSIIVLAHDLLPENTLHLLRKFMEKGGIIIWIGDIPFIKVLSQSTIKSMGKEGGIKVLGFYPSTSWITDIAFPTREGEDYGLVFPTLSIRSIDRSLIDIALSINSEGEASSWIKRIGKGMFIRLLDRGRPIKGSGYFIFSIFLDSLLTKIGVSYTRAAWTDKVKEKAKDIRNKGQAIAFDIVLSSVFDVGKSPESVIKEILHGKNINVAVEKLAKDIEKGLSIGDTFWIGQSHLDWAWLWTWEVSIEKCRFTLKQALEHMKKYPNFKYTQSTAAYYEWMEKYYPDIFEEIKKRIGEGRWGLVGGSWVEHDSNIPSGESMIRQRLYGQRYYLLRFGKIADVEWMPDTFGFTWTLPQIMLKSGQKYMFTTKMDWSYVNKLPFRIFLWEGLDGSKVLAYQGRFAHGYYLSQEVYNEFASRTPLMKGTYNSVHLPKEKTNIHVEELGMIYGAGDGGRGPTPLEVMAVDKLSKLFSKVKQITGDEYMHLLEKYVDKLPTWRDELYLENHRGTYTAQWIIKSLNRDAENLLVTAEKAAVIAFLNGYTYPSDDFRDAWKWLLSYQWHDPLPGSAIKEVYEEAKRDFNTYIFPVVRKILEDSITSLQRGDRENIVVFNPLSWERRDIVEIEYKGYIPETDAQLTLDGKLVFAVDIGPIRFKTMKIRKGKPSLPTIKIVDKEVEIENKYYKLKVSVEGVLSLYDKELNKEFLKDKISIVSYYCKPAQWGNWNIMPGYWKHREDVFRARRILFIEGPVYSAVILEGEIDGSPAIWEIRLYSEIKRIDFLIWLDWRKTDRIVKMWVPTSLDAEYVHSSIPFGVYPRPFKPRTSFEKEKWEFPHQKWVCISDNNYGISIANWPIYGSGIIEGVYGLTLVKSGTEPDPYCDIYPHMFRISFNTFAGSWKEGMPWRPGDEINYPLYSQYIKGNIDVSFIESIEPKNIVIEAVKKHEDSSNIVLRVYDATGEGGRVRIVFRKKIREAYELDFIELNTLANNIGIEDSSIIFEMKPWEIKTISISF